MRRHDGTEIDAADAARLIAETIHAHGDEGIEGQAELAYLVGLSQRNVTLLMPMATQIAAALYPGETLRLRQESQRVYRYGVTDNVTSPDWFGITLRRISKAITAYERAANEVRGLPHQGLHSATANMDAVSLSMRAALELLRTIVDSMTAGE